jgi:hypothetical protein
MISPSKSALELKERDYCIFSLGKFTVWVLSLFCLFCIKICPKKTTKTSSKYTTFPSFVTSVLYWVLGFKPVISLIFKKHNIDNYKVNSDSYLSLPNNNNIIEWHRDGGFDPELDKISVGNHYIKFFIYLNPEPFKQKTSFTLKNSEGTNSGALSLVPASSCFAKAVENAMANEFISIGPNTNILDLVTMVRNILAEMDRQNMQSYFGLDRKDYEKFIYTVNNKLLAGSESSKFFKSFTVYPGKVVLFDVKALHRGEATIDSTRLVLRIIATSKK